MVTRQLQIVRIFDDADAKRLAEIDRLAFGADAHADDMYSAEEYRVFLQDEHIRIIAAKQGQEIVGFVRVGLSGNFDDHDAEMTILSLCVDPQHQRSGIGTQLGEFALAFGKKFGCDRVTYSTDNPVALHMASGRNPNVLEHCLRGKSSFSFGL